MICSGPVVQPPAIEPGFADAPLSGGVDQLPAERLQLMAQRVVRLRAREAERVGGAASAVAIIVGSRLMDSGDFTTPFMIMAAAYLASTMVYWRVFRPLELSEIERRSAADEPTAVVVAD